MGTPKGLVTVTVTDPETGKSLRIVPDDWYVHIPTGKPYRLKEMFCRYERPIASFESDRDEDGNRFSESVFGEEISNEWRHAGEDKPEQEGNPND